MMGRAGEKLFVLLPYVVHGIEEILHIVFYKCKYEKQYSDHFY